MNLDEKDFKTGEMLTPDIRGCLVQTGRADLSAGKNYEVLEAKGNKISVCSDKGIVREYYESFFVRSPRSSD